MGAIPVILLASFCHKDIRILGFYMGKKSLGFLGLGGIESRDYQTEIQANFSSPSWSPQSFLMFSYWLLHIAYLRSERGIISEDNVFFIVL
jgi:hypothetical protein